MFSENITICLPRLKARIYPGISSYGVTHMHYIDNGLYHHGATLE